jgi:hypothetical protein
MKHPVSSNNNSSNNNINHPSSKSSLLRNLGEYDVVFGTKGNGRNENFLRFLEDSASLYVQSSKFEKMSLIQKLIRDWEGNFYFLNQATNELCLAKGKKKSPHDMGGSQDGVERHDLMTPGEDPAKKSSKLYTSVRRMMNYVVAKNHHELSPKPQPKPQQRPQGKKPSAAAQASGKNISAKKRKQPSAVASSNKRKKKIKTSSAKAIPRSDATSPIPISAYGGVYGAASKEKSSIMFAHPKRGAMLVTPEPSPRGVFLPAVSIEERVTNRSQHGSLSRLELPRTLVPLSVRPLDQGNIFHSTSRIAANTPDMAATPPSIKSIPSADNEYIGEMEGSAIASLLSLSSASWSGPQDAKVRRYEFY